jgi:asparagine synthase (glutamine-hydrolysing)
MPGFSLAYNTGFNQSPAQKKRSDVLYNTISGKTFRLDRFVLNRYEADKIFFEDDSYIILLDGVITNSEELLVKTNRVEWKDCILELYKNDPMTFFKDFRGTFRGLIQDKTKDQWIIFNDHIGTKPLYFSHVNAGMFVSGEMTDQYHYLNSHNIEYHLNESAAYMLLSYGFMLDDITLCSEVRKLLPGHFIEIKNGNISINRYYSLPETSMEGTGPVKSESEYIELLDLSFRKAVTRQFEKDKEYGYKHLVALSGGLESRMTCWVADDLGYKDQLNITFSQSDYLDETIPKKIAADLAHEWLFKALDNGIFLKNIDEITAITGGNLLYSGSAHAHSMLKYINYANLGMLHSGHLGGAIISSYISDVKQDLGDLRPAGFYSEKYLSKIPYTSRLYTNQELFLFYQRGINGINNGLAITNQYTESMSPFYDLDFMEFCFRLPLKLRIGHNIYKKWIQNKYPAAGEYIWEKTKRPALFKSFYELKYKGKTRPIENIPGIIKSRIWKPEFGLDTKKHMNPFDYWYSTNADLREFQDKYFSEHIEKVQKVSKNLHSDLLGLYKGTALEKTQALSLVAAIKLFYSR